MRNRAPLADFSSFRPEIAMERLTWRTTAVVTLGSIAVLILWYWATVWSMVSIWLRSETFAHGFVIAPICAWLVWRDRRRIAEMEPRPYLPALLLLAGGGFLWLLANIAGVPVIEQFALVAMVPLIVWAILGTEVARQLWFPLAFLCFMVPAGEFLIPLLMDRTTDFVVTSLRLSGIPVYREGNYFSIPSGQWSVIEACAGLRYLIASLTLGVLYAYLNYRTLWRRLAFVAAAIVVPILANWVRAYLIIIIANASDNRLATGVDHLIYGWLFFGFVMLLLYWVGSIWREDLDQPRPSVPGHPKASVRRDVVSKRQILAVAVGAVLIAAVWREVPIFLDRIAPQVEPRLDALGPPPGWRVDSQPITTWVPHFLRPRVALHESFSDASSRVGLYIGYYSLQRIHGELVTWENRLVMTTNHEWANVGEGHTVIAIPGQSINAIETELRGPSQRLLVWNCYWINGRFTDNDYVAKALIAWNNLIGRGDDSAELMAFTPLDPNRINDLEVPRATLRRFFAAALPSIEQHLDAAREGSPR